MRKTEDVQNRSKTALFFSKTGSKQYDFIPAVLMTKTKKRTGTNGSSPSQILYSEYGVQFLFFIFFKVYFI